MCILSFAIPADFFGAAGKIFNTFPGKQSAERNDQKEQYFFNGKTKDFKTNSILRIKAPVTARSNNNIPNKK